MSKTEADIIEELEDLEQLLREALQTKGALMFVDLKFLAQLQSDLKQELRIAKVKGE